jgi:sulfoxide reductase heme-binding subunit YedZ
MALWYFTRATGAVSLLLLTVTVLLGVVNVGRITGRHAPRFLVEGVHRTVSLLVVVFVGVHVVTAVLDSFAPIRIIDAFIPFGASYRPLWVGLGAVAFDLLLALVVTSLLRARLGARAWRSVHWFAYACWPFALVHGLGTGSDVKPGWLLWLSIGCAAAVAVALLARASMTYSPGAALAGTATVIGLATIALAMWLPGGPLAGGWAKKAGTPRSLLHPGTARRRG